MIMKKIIFTLMSAPTRGKVRENIAGNLPHYGGNYRITQWCLQITYITRNSMTANIKIKCLN